MTKPQGVNYRDFGYIGKPVGDALQRSSITKGYDVTDHTFTDLSHNSAQASYRM